MIKPKTLIIIGLILLAMVGMYYLQVWGELNDFVDDDLFPDDEYPEGWNIPGNANYIVVSGPQYNANGVEMWNFKSWVAPLNTNSDVWVYYGSGNLILSMDDYLAKGYMTQTQYDCGLAQIEALEG